MIGTSDPAYSQWTSKRQDSQSEPPRRNSDIEFHANPAIDSRMLNYPTRSRGSSGSGCGPRFHSPDSTASKASSNMISDDRSSIALDKPSLLHTEVQTLKELSIQTGSPLSPASADTSNKRAVKSNTKRPRSSITSQEGLDRHSPSSNKRSRPRLDRTAAGLHHVVADTTTSNTLKTEPQFVSCNTIPKHRDSGYGSRKNTDEGRLAAQVQQLPRVVFNSTIPAVQDPLEKVKVEEDIAQKLRTQSKDWLLPSQLNSSSITLQQLEFEIQKILDDLNSKESQCRQYVEQANDPQCILSDKQKQTLVAYHRTLLYDHHDLLMATQHPVATPNLRALAVKHNIPSRLWRHGIHNFLELLRRRRSEAQEFMAQFLTLSYQMMALLYETVPAFFDTWIECLGDLARYRMAVEEDKDSHALWSITAAGWYTMAADRHPIIGRINHHLGILEKPSLSKVFLYSKSLVCRVRFGNAWESLATFYAPISERKWTASQSSTVEAAFVAYQALSFSRRDPAAAEKAATAVLSRLDHIKPHKLREIGAMLVITNLANVFQHGSSTNQLWQLHNIALIRGSQDRSPHLQKLLAASAAAPVSNADQLTISITYECFHRILRLGSDRDALNSSLPAVHVMLLFMHSLILVRHFTRDISRGSDDWYDNLMNPRRCNWMALCRYLNALLKATEMEVDDDFAFRARHFQFPLAKEGEFSQPVPSDYPLNGLIFAQFYYQNDFFDARIDKVERYAMRPEKQAAEARRVLYLGLVLAFYSGFISFDLDAQQFLPPTADPDVPAAQRLLPHTANNLADFSQRRNSTTKAQTLTIAAQPLDGSCSVGPAYTLQRLRSHPPYDVRESVEQRAPSLRPPKLTRQYSDFAGGLHHEDSKVKWTECLSKHTP